MSFFDDDEEFASSEMPPLRAEELEEFANSNANEPEDELDAFNEETFETALDEGADWEQMHDQLIMLEGKSNGDGGGALDRTLTKLDDEDEDDDENDYYSDGVVEKKHVSKGHLQPNNNLKQQVQQQQQQPPSQPLMFQQHQLQQQQLQQFQQNLLNNFSSKHAANNGNGNGTGNVVTPPQNMSMSAPPNIDKMSPFMPIQPTPEIQQVVLEQQRIQAFLNELMVKVLQTSSMPDPNSDQFKLIQQLQLQLQLKQKQYQMLLQQQFMNQIKNQPNGNMLESLLLAQQQQQQQQMQMQQGGLPNNKLPFNLNNLLAQNANAGLQAPGIGNNSMQKSSNVPMDRLQSMLNSAGYPQNPMNQQPPVNNQVPQLDTGKVKDMMEKFGQMNLAAANIQAQQQQQQTSMDAVKLQEQQKQMLLNLLQNKLQQQQQSQAPPAQQPPQPAPVPPMPGMSQPPKLSNVKTLEEIEAELLNQSSSSSSSKQPSQSANQNQFNSNSKGPSILNTLMQQHQSSGSPLNNQDKNPKDEDRNNLNKLLSSMANSMKSAQQIPTQQQMQGPPPPMGPPPQMDLMKMIPYIYAYLNTNNIGNFNNLNEQQQKQLIQFFAIQQQQFMLQQFQQQNNQHHATANNSQATNNNEQFMQQQQQLAAMLSGPNNGNLPPNMQHLSQQQKSAILSQLQENMQASNMLQQQQQMFQRQQNQANSNDDGGSQQSNLDYLMQKNDMNNNSDGQNNKRNNNNNNNMNRRHNDRSDDRRNNNINNNNNRQQQQRSNFSNNNLNNPTGDKLAGMMTEKEKNWVVNVQMLQLQIDDPYTFDFYYTAWMLKKKQFMQNNNSAALKTSVLFQSNNKHDQKNYRPSVTFENSLGKVTMSNFHHPRALIDINKPGDHQQQASNQLASHIDGLDDEDDENKKEKKNMSTILLEIENMYQVYLSIDEIEHKILKAPEELRVSLFQDRRARVDKLASMMCSENFAHYLFVPKGKRLLGKCIPTFNIHQTKQILGYFMQYIYIISKNNISLDEIYSQLSYAIDTQKFNDLVDIVNQFVHLYSRQSNQLYQTIFSKKFGLTYLLKFFSKTDLVQQDDYDNDVKSIWSAYLNLVLTGLTTVQPTLMSSEGNLEWNVGEEYQLNPKAVLDNFAINPDLWSANEKKLKELFKFVSDD